MNNQFSWKNLFRLTNVYGLAIIFISVNQLMIPFLPAAQSAQWSTPETIPLYHLETFPPILVADQNRTVHSFSTQWIKGESNESFRAIVYNRWTLEQGWTTPTDILISPNKEARVTDVHLDQEGVFHVVFFGGDYTSADIYYTKAPAAIADDPRAWSAPFIIGENAGDPECAELAEDDQGTLYVVYSSRQLGNSLYVVNSSDGGEKWSDSTQIFLSQGDEPTISLLHVIKGNSGGLHAIWGVYNFEGLGRGIYYIGLKDGNKWSEPVLLADVQDGLGTQTPTIIEHKGTLIALYNMPPKITMRRSMDDGQTWDAPSTLFPRHVGVNGSLSLVIDGNNDLHLFFGQRITGDPDIHGMWHSVFLNDHWIEPEGIVRGPKILDLEGYNGFDPNAAKAVVSQGNVILVTWRTDPGSKGNGVWFSYKKVDAPELPIIPLPTSTSNLYETLSNENSYLAFPTPTSAIVKNILLDDPPTTITVGNIIAITLITVILFLILFFVSILRKRSS